MKKLGLIIFLILSAIYVQAQVSAKEVEAKKRLILALDSFYSTTQVDLTDTTLATKVYVDALAQKFDSIGNINTSTGKVPYFLNGVVVDSFELDGRYLLLTAIGDSVLANETDPIYIADTSNIAYLDQYNAFTEKMTLEGDTIYHAMSRILSGVSEDKQDIYLTVSGGNVYFEVEKSGGGDVEYIFGKGSEYDLDCTTGAGVGGRARVILTEGTATAYVRNYIYVTHSGGVAVLNASTSLPTGEFAWVGMATIQSDTEVTADGAVQFQRMDESFYGTDLRGQLSKMREKLRWLGAEYIQDGGILQTFTITEGSPDVGVLTTTAGQVYQLHRNTWNAYNMATDGLWIANASGTGTLTKNQKIFDINTIRETSDGTAIINNDRVVFTIWGSMNSMGQQKMWLNLPTDVYASNANALVDVMNYSVTTAPKEFQTTAFLVCKIVLKYNNTGQWKNLVGGTAVQDLRGVPMGFNLGGNTTTTTQSFSDADFELFSSGDASKVLTYDASGITPSTTRVWTIQDASGTVALTSNLLTDFDSTGFELNSGQINEVDPIFAADSAQILH